MQSVEQPLSLLIKTNVEKDNPSPHVLVSDIMLDSARSIRFMAPHAKLGWPSSGRRSEVRGSSRKT